MSKILKYSKEDFIKLINSYANYISSSNERSIDYLKSESIDTDKFVEEGINRIRQIKLRIAAEETMKEMELSKSVKDRAIEKVKEILSKADFSFASFVQQEGLVLQNRNIESFTEKDIERTLINYYFLKFLDQNKKND